MFLRKRFIHLMIIIVMFSGSMYVSIVKADPNNVETKIGWSGISASSFAIKDDGSLWEWNFSDSPVDLSYDLKKFDASVILVPTLVAGISDVKAVASGGGVSLALKNDGTVWAVGFSNKPVVDGGKQLINFKQPFQVKNLTDVITLSGDWTTTFALKKDGTLWVVSYEYSKADGSNGIELFPVQLSQFSDIVGVSQGWGNTIALKKDGTVWMMVSWEPVQIEGLADIVEIAAGGQYSYGLKKDGTVWFWGSKGVGSMGAGHSAADDSPPSLLAGITNVISIQASAGGPLLLKNDGTVWASGLNSGGQLGIGSYKNSDVPVQVKGLTKIITIAASGTGFDSKAIKEDHTLWSWGIGGVGDGTSYYRTTPVMIKSYDSEALQKWDTIKVEVNEDELVFEQPPVLINNRTMVPLRKIFEAIGATIVWDPKTSTLTATKGQIIIKLTIGSKVAFVNDKQVSLDTPAIVVNDKTLVPVRFIGDSFGAKVTWDDVTKSVVIISE